MKSKTPITDYYAYKEKMNDAVRPLKGSRANRQELSNQKKQQARKS